ncbi:ABC transporter ATP-binding protein [Clostridium sp. UBA6640]|uniref:ABC transporter ATP-binding protein n=1 Tax=Clostridium sp. UBA6640 TaxID=1946370 RepID=UPI0025C564EB|nr:ABC transporter ATP-binding protein [Clostridium sp. UBA6640]
MEKEKYTVEDIIKIPFSCDFRYALVIMFQKILQGLVPTMQVIATAKFLDVAMAIVNGKADYNEIFLPLTLVIIFIAYNWISSQLIKLVEVKLEIKLREKFRVFITEKRAKLKYKHIENKDTWDLISRVAKDPEVQCANAYKSLLDMAGLIIRILGILLVLITQVWWSAVIILAVSIPLFALALKSGKANYEVNREVSKYRRKYEYLKEVITGREAADERALFSYTDEMNKKWWQEYERGRKIEYKTNVKWYIKMKMGSVITALISILIVIVLINPVKQGLLTIGMFISVVNGVFSLVQMMSWQLAYYTQELATNKERLNDLTDFINLEEREGAIDKPDESGIKLNSLEFKNVSFKYPGTDNYILKNISFNIEEGKHYAFVGVNGSGKTTITKLITGLYEEFEGKILINGVNIKEYSHSKLKSLCSVVYQDFAKYFITLKDNIALGHIRKMDNDLSNEDINKIVNIIDLADVIEKLPNGLNSYLGKIKSDGLDVSGGQWQRIGMARSIISDAPLRILDEPTAALDPISESNIYEKFEEISRGGTTIFISHRLGSTKLANEIFVIENGAIVEKGSHDELMEINGTYADMYESQRSWYL